MVRIGINKLIGKRTLHKEDNRIIWIDQVKGVGILLVLIGHMNISNLPMLWNFIYSFHMPLFFILSGFMLKFKENWKNFGFRSFLYKKLRSLIVPYFGLSFLCLLFLTIEKFVFRLNYNDVIDALFQTVTFNGYKSLWFLVDLFLAEIIFFIVHKYFMDKLPKIFYYVIQVVFCVLVVAFLAFVYPNIQISGYFANLALKLVVQATFSYLFVEVGYYAFNLLLFLENFKAINLKGKYRDFQNLFFSLLFLSIGTVASFFNGKATLLYINNPIFYMSSAFFCSFGIILFIKTLNFNNRFLSYIGINSLIIMGTHLQTPMDFAYIITSLINKLFILLGLAGLSNLVYNILVLGVLIVIELLIVILVSRWLPFLVSKKCVEVK